MRAAPVAARLTARAELRGARCVAKAHRRQPIQQSLAAAPGSVRATAVPAPPPADGNVLASAVPLTSDSAHITCGELTTRAHKMLPRGVAFRGVCNLPRRAASVPRASFARLAARAPPHRLASARVGRVRTPLRACPWLTLWRRSTFMLLSLRTQPRRMRRARCPRRSSASRRQRRSWRP
jgi:hypothetical protein